MSAASKAWSSSVLPAVIVPSAISDTSAFAGASFERWDLLDRASYSYSTWLADGIADVLVGIASSVTGRSLAWRSHRLMRLDPGDYILSNHDPMVSDRPVELILDLSASAVDGAEVHYRHRGQVFFVVPSAPGSLAIVERGPTVTSNHTYVSMRQPASVLRLSVLLGTKD